MKKYGKSGMCSPQKPSPQWQELMTHDEGEMVGWHHRLNGHGFGCTP